MINEKRHAIITNEWKILSAIVYLRENVYDHESFKLYIFK